MPAPSHSLHGVSGIRPSPSHWSQIDVRTSWPNAVRATRWCWPVPSQRGQSMIGVPGSAPLPWQCRAQRRRLVGDLDLRAARGLREVDRGGHDDVAALDRPAAAPAPPGAERGVEAAGAEESREQVGDRAERVHVRRVAAAAQAVLAVGVVELAPLGVGEHLVGGGRLLELLLRVGVVGVDVGVQLAREPRNAFLILASSAPRSTPSVS